VREVELSGSLLAARRIGNAVHTVVAEGDQNGPGYETRPADLDTCGTEESIVRAKLAALKKENERKLRAKPRFPTVRDRGAAAPVCTSLLRTARHDGQAFTTVVSFDLGDDAAPPVTAALESRPGAVFASSDALYLSVVHRKEGAGRWYSWNG
jgi:hypothetical protein